MDLGLPNDWVGLIYWQDSTGNSRGYWYLYSELDETSSRSSSYDPDFWKIVIDYCRTNGYDEKPIWALMLGKE